MCGFSRLRSLVPGKLMLRQEVSRFDHDEKKIIFVGSLVMMISIPFREES